MFYNGSRCDIYVGPGAGKMLCEDIKQAHRSVRIVSPYLAPGYVAELIRLKKRGVEVSLITMDTVEDYANNKKGHEKILPQLIIQQRETDREAEQLRNKRINRVKRLYWVILGLVFIEIILAYFFRDVRVIYGILPIIITVLAASRLSRKIKRQKIYSYTYSTLFNLRVYERPEFYINNWIHAKIYIIDERVAYLGSMNFTYSGMRSNFEARIKITDKEAIRELINEFERLYAAYPLEVKDIQKWGRCLYLEPIN